MSKIKFNDSRLGHGQSHDLIKIGAKGYFSNSIVDLIEALRTDNKKGLCQYGELRYIEDSRYSREGLIYYSFFYLVEESDYDDWAPIRMMPLLFSSLNNDKVADKITGKEYVIGGMGIRSSDDFYVELHGDNDEFLTASPETLLKKYVWAEDFLPIGYYTGEEE